MHLLFRGLQIRQRFCHLCIALRMAVHTRNIIWIQYAAHHNDRDEEL